MIVRTRHLRGETLTFHHSVGSLFSLLWYNFCEKALDIFYVEAKLQIHPSRRTCDITAVSFVMLSKASMDGALNASSHIINSSRLPQIRMTEDNASSRLVMGARRSVRIRMLFKLYSESQSLHRAEYWYIISIWLWKRQISHVMCTTRAEQSKWTFNKSNSALDPNKVQPATEQNVSPRGVLNEFRQICL